MEQSWIVLTLVNGRHVDSRAQLNPRSPELTQVVWQNVKRAIPMADEPE